MRTILTLGIACLILGLIPQPTAQEISRSLMWEKVRHMKCDGVCFIVDREIN